jgi:hypothetical protein
MRTTLAKLAKKQSKSEKNYVISRVAVPHSFHPDPAPPF